MVNMRGACAVGVLFVSGCAVIVGLDNTYERDDGSGEGGSAASTSASGGAGGEGGSGGGAVTCGNGQLDAAEVCDDGNTIPGDGCDDACLVEECFECPDNACSPAMIGTPCGSVDESCDGAGACISHCSDGTKNVDEIGVDCGGSCKNCLAAPCTMPAECASSFCADGVCCKQECNQACTICNMKDSIGTCAYVPAGVDDDQCTGDANTSCFGQGKCITVIQWQNGEPCMDYSECISGQCSQLDSGEYKCGAPSGSACKINEECASGVCFMVAICNG